MAKAASVAGAELSSAVSFDMRVGSLCIGIPRGKVTTYGAMARALN
jgi:alkylated DNA nucleotide flippase Atl1